MLFYSLTSAITKIRTLFKVAVSAIIKPETPSCLMSNESSGSLLSNDVPAGYEIWTQNVWHMPGNMMVIKCYSDLTVTKMNLH